MKKHIITILAVAVLAFQSACTSYVPTRIRTRDFSGAPLGKISVPLKVTVELPSEDKKETTEDVKAMVEEKLAAAFKKANIPVAAEAKDSVKITIGSAYGMSPGKRFMVGDLGKKDFIETLIEWSDGTSLKLKIDTGVVIYATVAPLRSTHLEKVAERVAEEVVKATKDKLN